MPERTPRRATWKGAGRAAAGAALGLLIGGLLALARGLPVVEGLELELVDLRTRAFAGERPPDPRIVLCEVQDADLEALRPLGGDFVWPWGLGANAACVQVLADAGARALVVDVMHLDRGAGDDDRVAAPGTRVDAALTMAETGAAEDYAAALRRIPRTAIAMELAYRPEYQNDARVAAAVPRLQADGLTPPAAAPARPGANLPVRRVAEGAAALGFVNVLPDADGVVRRAAVVGRWGERPVVSLALAGARLAADAAPRLEGGALVLGDVRTPLHDDATFLVDFRGPADAPYRRVAPSQLVAWDQQRGPDGALPAAARQALDGAVVVWGVNLSGQKDVVATPMSGGHRGPEVQATVIDDLLRGGGRVRASRAANALCLLAGLALAGALATHLKPRWAPHAVAFLAAAVPSLLAFAAFRHAGVSFDLFTPWLGVVLLWGAVYTLRFWTEGRYNRWLEGAFGRYLAPSVIEAIKKDPALLELGGRRREVSVLFSDVAGFTVASKKLAPDQIVRLLNEYLTAHCDEVFATGGVVDKFIGDAVMAFWGDPVPVPDHAERACRTALAVQRRLPELEPLWRSLGLDEFRVRIGVNSGPAVVGNMGSRQRFDYTAMGDTVNLASRLEGANKAFHTTILLGPRTREGAGDAIVALALGGVQVVGYDEPVPVHVLVAMAAEATPAERAQAAAWRRAQEAARADDLEGALAALEEAEGHAPGHGAHAWFRGVLEALGSGRVPRPWSGVIVLSGK